jgi:hypothetical protein
MSTTENIQQIKREQTDNAVNNGHDISSERVQTVVDYIKSHDPDVKVIDVSNILNNTTENRIYENMSTFILAERNDSNDSIFAKRDQGETHSNMLAVYKGTFKCFNFDTEWEQAKAILFD